MKKNSGITLIALAITMVIMLIIAAISVTALSGDNSLIHNVGEAKDGADAKNEKDIIDQAVYQAINNNRFGELDATELQSVLNNLAGSGKVTITPSGTKLKAHFTDSGRSYIINENGQSKETTKVKVGDTDLSTVSDLSTKYGEIVDYKSVSHPNIDWQLFYDDSNNYYVIASDYVPNAELPCNGNTGYGATDLIKSTSTTNQWATYCAGFCSNASYNDGVLTAGTIYKNGSASTAFSTNLLTSTYLKWVAANSSSTNNNIFSVAYMMDTNKWSSFADGVGGSFAIGGPTMEMLSLSWNAVSEHTKMTDYKTLSSSNSNTNGYILNKNEENNNFFGSETNIWFIKEETKARAYWIAAPAYEAANRMMALSFYRSCYKLLYI